MSVPVNVVSKNDAATNTIPKYSGSASGLPVLGNSLLTDDGVTLRYNGTPVAGGGSGVTAVSGTAPVVSSGGNTPAISIPKATGSVDGYLSSTDWSTFNGKQNVPANQGPNVFYSGPISGAAQAPIFRAINSADLPSVITPKVIYSAAGTPLPAADPSLIGAQAVVSDATTPTYMGAYVSGGAVVAAVICDGSGWFTH